MPRDSEAALGRRQAGARSRVRRRTVLLLLGPIVLVATAAYAYLAGGRYVSTDDAYLRYDKVQISSDVAGRVVESAIDENQVVKQGELLFALDDEPYRISLAHADAALAQARQDVTALHAAYRQKLANLKAAQASADFLQREYERQKRLAQQNVSSASKVDEAGRSAEVARQQVAALQQEVAQALATLGGDPDQPIERHPRVLEALAARDRAALDLRHTRIYAPADGIVANVDPRPGQYMNVGQPMASLLESGSLYVEANLKETELTYVKPGDEATVTVDSYPDRQWRARVLSIGAGTGSEFSVLPPQNASGNWVKIVQRLPVRLKLLPGQDIAGLRAGMSVTAEIDTHHRRSLAGLIGGS